MAQRKPKIDEPSAEAAGSTEFAEEAASASSAKPRFGPGNGYPAYHSKIDDLLRDDDRDEYERMLVRGVSTRKVWSWLKERGYRVGRCTVERHKMRFLRGVYEVRHGADVAERFARFARAAGLTMSDSVMGGFHQVLMQFFTRQQLAQAIDGKQVQAIAAGVDAFVDTNARVERARHELEGATADAKPADLGAVVDRVREILG